MNIGVRSLKNHVHEVINQLGETGETITITSDGEPIAIIEAAREPLGPVEYRAFWQWHRRLIEAVTRQWSSERSSGDGPTFQRVDVS